MNTYDLYPQISIRPGVGQTQGSTFVATNIASGFVTVRTLPPSANNSVEYTRINMIWAPTNGASVLIAFGPADNAALDSALAGSPPFALSHGILRFLMQPNDTGFKMQPAFGTAPGGTLSWYLG